MGILRNLLFALTKLVPNVSQQDFTKNRGYQTNLTAFLDLNFHFEKVTVDTVSKRPF